MNAVRIDIEGSKSLALRYMVMNHISGCSPRMLNMPRCEDVANMRYALEHLKDSKINIGEGAAPLRFFTALTAATPGTDVVIESNGRLPQRPMQPLIDALCICGADIENPPLHIRGKKLTGGTIYMPADISSQFLSAMMLIAPLMQGHLNIEVISREFRSFPYALMTAHVMQQYGYTSIATKNEVMASALRDDTPLPEEIMIESDWSSVAAILPFVYLLDKSIEVPHLSDKSGSLQPDSVVFDKYIMEGIRSQNRGDGYVFYKKRAMPFQGVSYDASDTPDIVLSDVVFHILLDKRIEVTGIDTLKHKECDRARALCLEVAKLGYKLHVTDDTIIYKCEHEEIDRDITVELDPHGDHRLAMALAQFKTRYPNINIKDRKVVNKSYPSFWQDIQKLGLNF